MLPFAHAGIQKTQVSKSSDERRIMEGAVKLGEGTIADSVERILKAAEHPSDALHAMLVTHAHSLRCAGERNTLPVNTPI